MMPVEAGLETVSETVGTARAKRMTARTMSSQPTGPAQLS
jgi:hypothetical protein